MTDKPPTSLVSFPSSHRQHLIIPLSLCHFPSAYSPLLPPRLSRYHGIDLHRPDSRCGFARDARHRVRPFQSLLAAYLEYGPDNEYLVKKTEDKTYKPATKSALKNAANHYEAQREKQAAAVERAETEAEEQAALRTALDKANTVQATEDPSQIAGPLRRSVDDSAQVFRIKVSGRVFRLAKQGGIIFVTLRRGLEHMQCLLAGQLTKTYDALMLVREVPPGLHAPLDRELHADFFKISATAPGGEGAFTNRVPEDRDPNTLLNLRHLALRHGKPNAVMSVRTILESSFLQAYKELRIPKASPPALVQIFK